MNGLGYILGGVWRQWINDVGSVYTSVVWSSELEAKLRLSLRAETTINLLNCVK